MGPICKGFTEIRRLSRRSSVAARDTRRPSETVAVLTQHTPPHYDLAVSSSLRVRPARVEDVAKLLDSGDVEARVAEAATEGIRQLTKRVHADMERLERALVRR